MPLASEDYGALKQYFNGAKSSYGDPSDIAKAILLNAQTTTYKASSKKKNEPSLMGRLLDILSRGNYASAEFIQTIDENAERENDENPLYAALEGLKGKRKTTFQQVLTGPTVGLEKGAGTSLLGLGLDIFADPTTYIPIAGIAAKVSSLARRGAKVAPETNLAQDLLAKGEPINPEVYGLPAKAPQTIPEVLQGAKPTPPVDKLPAIDLGPRPGFISNQPTLPGFEGRIPLPEITPRKTKELPDKPLVGQTYLKFPDFSLATAKVERAEDIVSKVAKGDPEAIVRIAPSPKEHIEPRFARMGDEILAGWDSSKTTAKLNKEFPNTLNAKQQVKLYYLAIEKARKQFKKPFAAVNKPRVDSAAYKIYLSMEKTLKDQGLVPRISSGEDVSLADVISQLGGSSRAREVLDEFTKDLVQGTPTWQAVQALRASSAVTDVPASKAILDKIIEAKSTVASNPVVSEGKLKEFDGFFKKFSKVVAKDSGISPAAARTVTDLTKTALLSSKSRAQIAVEQKAKMLDEIVAKGGSTKEINKVLTLALEKDLGKLPQWAVNDNQAVEFLMGRVATWWGQADLRPVSLNAIGASAATAAARGKVIVNMFKGFDEASSLEAFLVAQGKAMASTPEIKQLAGHISATMENLVGKVNGESVLLRAGLDYNQVNKWMRQYRVGFTFIKSGKMSDPFGLPVDYSKGSDWVNSWKSAEITADPATVLFKFQEAIEQATREKALFDEIGERFGQPVPGGDFTRKLEGYPYLQGYYFPKDIAEQLPRVVKDWSNQAWHSNSKAVQLYDRVLSMWKSGVTIYRPAHHIRNMIGDVYLGWMDGVNSLKPYKLAVQVQKSMRGAYTTIQDVDKLVKAGLVVRGVETPTPGKALFRNRSGIPFTAEQIAAVAHQKGLLEHTRTIEDIIDLGGKETGILNFQPFGGKVQAVARGASELQSHNARLAHFIDKVMKSKGSNLAEIFESAARRSRKWHPTGLDLTDFEKSKLRRTIAFYSWMRKSLPLLAEGLVMNPGKVIMPAKAGEAVQTAQGIETGGREDPFPVDQMFPRWIRSQGIGPISFPDGALGKFTNQQPPGYVMAGMGLDPLAELVSQIQSPGKTLMSSLTPAIKVPVELMQGRESFSQEPISGPDARPGAFSEYVGQQIPIFSALQGITGTTLSGGDTKSATRSGDAGKEALINWLTGLGIKGTGPYVKQARYEKLAPMRTQRSYDRDRLLSDLRNWEEGR